MLVCNYEPYVKQNWHSEWLSSSVLRSESQIARVEWWKLHLAKSVLLEVWANRGGLLAHTRTLIHVNTFIHYTSSLHRLSLFVLFFFAILFIITLMLFVFVNCDNCRSQNNSYPPSISATCKYCCATEYGACGTVCLKLFYRCLINVAWNSFTFC